MLVNNSDGLGNSYGSHLSLLVTRRTFDNLFDRKLHHMLYLASYQASSIILTGQGKVGAENGAADVAYQIAQRADFFETLCGHQTTHHRPLVNCRDEPLCGSELGRGVQIPGLARLHVIFYDSNLCHVANLLKTGVLQIVASMIESECVDPGLILDDPVSAVIQWSHDPDLRTRVRLADGRRLNAVEHQQQIFDAAQRFIARGGCEGIVPEAGRILEIWGQTLGQLRNRDFEALAACLDWVLKRRTLERALAVRSDLTWRSPEIKRLDHLYSSLDPEEGLYWACERAGLVQRLADGERIKRCRQRASGGHAGLDARDAAAAGGRSGRRVRRLGPHCISPDRRRRLAPVSHALDAGPAHPDPQPNRTPLPGRPLAEGHCVRAAVPACRPLARGCNRNRSASGGTAGEDLFDGYVLALPTF